MDINKKPHIVVEGEYKGKKIKLESGELAIHADSSVLVTMGETTVLATVVSNPTKDITDFFPLRVDYEEKFYAGGIIGGSKFTRREGKPTDEAIISGRLIDHAIRPLFPKDFMNDTQLVVMVLSIDGETDPALLGFLAASAAFSTAGVPFNGPIVPLRITKSNGNLTADLNTSAEEHDLSIIVSYLENGKKVQAIEAHGHIIPEKEVIEAINFGASESKPLFDILYQFTEKSDVKTIQYDKSWLNKETISEFKSEVMKEILSWSSEGISYNDKSWGIKKTELAGDLESKYSERFGKAQFISIIGEIEKEWVRDLVLNKNQRIDGRKIDEIRPLSAKVGVLPRVHGSSLFTRGFTQSLTVITLASGQQKLLVQGMGGDELKHYMHHYNFPPFSTGEVGKLGATGRREIGHGMLAEKALLPVLPDMNEFPYAMRLVSEILSSNGSTSMASTCSSSLALMDAGVPISGHVGGIGVGLFVDTEIKNPKLSDYKLLTDIVGYEDFAGYMDFKMTGTRDGMTAIQLELKVQGIPLELIESIFEVSKTARMKVIDVLEKAISKPRAELSTYAPKVISITIDADKIGKVIGSGGSTIKDIMARTDTDVEVEEIADSDKASVHISSINMDNVNAAKALILGLVTDVEAGQVYTGTITRVENYGAFVEILPGKEGLLHVSEVSDQFVKDVTQLLKIGDTITVKVVSVDEVKGRIALSKKALNQNL